MRQDNARTSLTTHQVASALARWAMSRGLLESLPHEVDAQYLVESPEISLNTESEQILRQKELQSISYNAAGRVIYIYTRKKVTQKDLQVLPKYLFSVGMAYPQGHLDVVGKEPCLSQGSVYAVHSIPGRGDFYACGSSISPGNDASAGTLGALVRLQDRVLYGLTNNHVSALCSHVQPRTPILAPGVIDVSPNAIPPFTLGFHTRSLEMLHGSVGNIDIARNSDAAIFQIPNEDIVSSMQGNYFDTPTTIADPIEGMTVEKVGRTTRHTRGQIVSRELRPIMVNYHAQRYGFSGRIWFANVFVIHGLNTEFSSSGDSGSLVVSLDDQGNHAASVGLIFAGGPDAMAPGGSKSLMLPLRPILDALGATLVGGHNV